MRDTQRNGATMTTENGPPDAAIAALYEQQLHAGNLAEACRWQAAQLETMAYSGEHRCEVQRELYRAMSDARLALHVLSDLWQRLERAIELHQHNKHIT